MFFLHVLRVSPGFPFLRSEVSLLGPISGCYLTPACYRRQIQDQSHLLSASIKAFQKRIFSLKDLENMGVPIPGPCPEVCILIEVKGCSKTTGSSWYMGEFSVWVPTIWVKEQTARTDPPAPTSAIFETEVVGTLGVYRVLERLA